MSDESCYEDDFWEEEEEEWESDQEDKTYDPREEIVLQIHHFATNKHQYYTPIFNDIAKKYGLDLDGNWNKELLQHGGRHTNRYHEFVLEEMRNIDTEAQGDRTKFLQLYEKNVKSVVRSNPDILYSE